MKPSLSANVQPAGGRRVAVSNIAWAELPDQPFLDMVAAEGVCGIEVAPSLVWPEPAASSAGDRARFRSRVESSGLSIVGLHALLFTRRDLHLLSTGLGRQATLDYLNMLADLCSELGGRVLVLGSPANRRRGELSLEEANRRAASLLHDAGEYAFRRSCSYVIEALPPPGCDFVTDLAAGASLVVLADTPGVALHFDTGAATVTERDAGDERLVAAVRTARHCHVNDHELQPPGSSSPRSHDRWSRLLAAAGYRGWLTIEMRRTTAPKESLRSAIRFVHTLYGTGARAVSA